MNKKYLDKRLLILEQRIKQLREKIANIKAQAAQEERELTIDEQLSIQALSKYIQSEYEQQMKEYLQIRRIKKKRKQSLMSAALILLILLPLAWMIIPSNLENERIVEKPASKESPIPQKMPKKEVIPNLPIESPSSQSISQTPLLAKVDAKPLVTLPTWTNYRSVKDKKLAILDNGKVFSLWNKNQQDTLEFFLYNPQIDTVYTKALPYLSSVTLAKEDLGGDYHYMVLDKKYQVIHQGQVSMIPNPAQNE